MAGKGGGEGEAAAPSPDSSILPKRLLIWLDEQNAGVYARELVVQAEKLEEEAHEKRVTAHRLATIQDAHNATALPPAAPERQ